jgi:hypothetical protein
MAKSGFIHHKVSPQLVQEGHTAYPRLITPAPFAKITSQKKKTTFRLLILSSLLLKSENLLLFGPPSKMNNTIPLS